MGTAHSARLKEITDEDIQYIPGPRGMRRELGRGGMGVVYLARFNGKLVAVKKLQDFLLSEEVSEDAQQYRKEFMEEMEILLALNHPHILSCLGGSVTNNILITEFMCKGDLFSLLQKKVPGVHWNAYGSRIALQIAKAVAAMHEMRIIHRDLKTPNILVGHGFHVKVGDVGLAKRLAPNNALLAVNDEKYSTFWAAPEILMQKEIGSKSDIYSLGVIIWELYTQAIPWKHLKYDYKVIQAVCAGERNPLPDDMPQKLKDLISKCWAMDPVQRPTAEQVAAALEEIIQDQTASKQEAVELRKLDSRTIRPYSTALFDLAQHLLRSLRGKHPDLVVVFQILDVIIAIARHENHKVNVIYEVLDVILEAFHVLTAAGYELKAAELLERAVDLVKLRKLTEYEYKLSNLQEKLTTKLVADCVPLPQIPKCWEFITISQLQTSLPILFEVETTAKISETEAFLTSQYCHNVIIRRILQGQESLPRIIESVNSLVAALVQSKHFLYAWQLLIDVSKAIKGYGQFDDGIALRLAALAPLILNPTKPGLIYSVITSKLFNNYEYTWKKYRSVLTKYRRQFVEAARTNSEPKEFLSQQAKFSRNIKELLATMIKDSQDLLGPPPCKYAFCCLGSLSTDDVSLYSDVELLLLVEDKEAACWDEVEDTPTVDSFAYIGLPANNIKAEYFRALFLLLQIKIASIGESNFGFKLNTALNPGIEFRLRGTPQMILEYCKPPAASIEDPLTYSILTASYVYGNDSRTLLDELENIFFDALNDHIQTKNSCGHHFWQALIVKQNVAQNMKSAKYLFRHADDDLDNPFHYTKPLDLRKLAILTKCAVFDLARYHSFKPETVVSCIEKICDEQGIIPMELGQALIDFYARVQRFRALLHFHSKAKKDLLQIHPSGKVPQLDASVDKRQLKLLCLGAESLINIMYYGLQSVLKDFDTSIQGENEFPPEPETYFVSQARALLANSESAIDALNEASQFLRTTVYYFVLTGASREQYRTAFRALGFHVLRGKFCTILQNAIEALKLDSLQQVVDELLLYPDPSGNRPRLVEAQFHWIEQLRGLLSEIRRPDGIQIRMVGPRDVTLRPEIERRIFDSDGNIIPNVPRGRRPVHCLETPTCCIHFKANPEWPGMEFAVGSLCDLIVGGCTPFTTVWAVRRRNGTWYPVLVSQTIKGPTLQNLLLENPDATCFPQLDYKQYCQAVIMALLTNPEDGKSDNYIVTEHAGKYKVYSVDNDHSFVPPRVRRWFSMAPLVKCILFCFDEMMKPVHTEVREELCDLSINSCLETWLKLLSERDAQYLELFPQSLIEELFSARDDERICIPVMLSPDVIETIYKKLRKLQEVLNNSSSVTLLDLLQNLEPTLAPFYKEVLAKRLPIAQRFKIVAEREYHGEMVAGAGTTRTNMSHALESVLGVVPTLEEVYKGKKWRVHQVRAHLDNLLSFMQQIDQTKQNLINGISAPFKALPVDDARQQVIKSIDFTKLTEAQVKFVLKSIVGFDYTVLSLGSVKPLDSTRLNQILHYTKSLVVLDISDTSVEHLSTVETISKCCPLLTKLNMRNLPKLTWFAGGSRLNVLRVKFPRLKRLWLRGCTALAHFHIDAPELVDLELEGTQVSESHIRAALTQCCLQRFVHPDGTTVLIKTFVPNAGKAKIDADDKFIVSVGTDGFINFWDIATGNRVRSFNFGDALDCVQLLPNDKVVVAHRRKGIFIHDAITGDNLLAIPQSSTMFHVSQNKLVAYYSSQPKNGPPVVKSAVVWDIKTGECLGKLVEEDEEHARAFKNSMYVSGNLAVIGYSCGTAVVWDLRYMDKPLGVLQHRRSKETGAAFSIQTVHISSGFIATGSLDTKINIWDSNSLKLVRTIHSAHADPVMCIHARGFTMASGGFDGDPSVKIWNLQHKQTQLVCTLYGHKSRLTFVRVMSNTQFISMSTNKHISTVKIWTIIPPTQKAETYSPHFDSAV